MKTIKTRLIVLFTIFSLSVSAQNKAFEVEVVGKGQPILFFPGFTCTGEVWEDTVAELSKTNECHVFTFAGFGNVAPIEKPWLPKIKNAVEEYIKENNLIRPIVVGHSLGGALGLWMASEEIVVLDNLIVVDALPSTGALIMPNFNSDYMIYDSPYNKQTLAMSDEDFEAMASQMAQGMTMNIEKKDLIKNWMIQADRETYVYGYTDLLKLDLRKDISNIKIPVTVLGATQPYGKEAAQKNYKEQYKNLESYNLIFAEGAAHFIMFDNPEWFVDQLKAQFKQ
ncbi:pimeloyl-ACP methyl ester carboxylesterase [Saonia flava]|uniref:Pimeloyl-ACP methyl ester carboxylesterase n=1 Tax=Saonia flava TaxID=523696 RepID=A0A846R2D5_9FLAO|nr:alpha/beta hydrolase [Saonia flava]NJB71534.1 pimeloyl-ACP methyl ester carboxylesterase [Saonia flava]